MVRRMAFISDIHGNIEALRAVLNDIEEKGISTKDTYCLGDLVGYGPRPNEVIECMKEKEIQCILGNYDEAVGFFLPTCGCSIGSEIDRIRTKNSLSWTTEHTSDENKQFLRELEEQITVEVNGITILLTHGSPFSINDYVFEDDIEKQQDIVSEIVEDIIVFGHTHFPYYREVEGKLFINAGSVGRPKDGDNRACYCILEVDQDITANFFRVSYDVEAVAREIEDSELFDEFADVLRNGKVD
ncbi:MAG: phosphodiesterase, family [Anaerosolibacter sp.]|jgi:putative phosphoesterase|uniref:metallophosphoesterase family protein n=1 Tax=Anaerosolibacter sp. TaxID=1872527 RepID=UPI00260C7323|nr:metallophosphoesterase family protein [Anaerosolibacter sp.]MDF2547828.1 phosphodiesterase, family [Anaerosolibacter sp.]